MFKCYALVGIINTTVHYLVYFLLIASGLNQSEGNLIAFCIAVTCSYLLNAKFTFKAQYKPKEYCLYISFMGLVSYLIGYVGDNLGLEPILSLLVFSALSLFMGYKFSKILFLKEL